ncbi:MAG: DNA breaking-rejoining protein [Pseudomonadota bacterium]
MRLIGFLVFTALCAVAPFAAFADEMRTERVEFASGETGTSITGSVAGYNSVDYLVVAAAGQTMVVNMKTDNLSSYFNILAPGEENAAFFVGSTEGNSYEGLLPQSGEYRIRVYLMRNAARRDETANYTIDIMITSSGDANG